MKVWITKYALTDGIIEGEAEDRLTRNPYWGIVFFDRDISGCRCGCFVIGVEDCFKEKESAIKKAEEMRQKKIESLKKQIKKLEEMRFEKSV